MRPPRLYADMGNSALLWAVSGRAGWGPYARMVLDPAQTPRDTAVVLRAMLEAAGCAPDAFAGAALVSSNPRMTEHALAALAAVVPEVVLLGRDLHSDLPVQYHVPERFGQDRIAAIEGARELCGAPVVAMTCGTCLTAQALTREGTIIAGGIAPGLSILVAGLCDAVPHLADAARAAEQAILRGDAMPSPAADTVESLTLGVSAAICGAAQVMALAMLDEAGAREPVLLTGAAAEFVEGVSPGAWRVEPLLTLEGLRAVHERWLEER